MMCLQEGIQQECEACDAVEAIGMGQPHHGKLGSSAGLKMLRMPMQQANLVQAALGPAEQQY